MDDKIDNGKILSKSINILSRSMFDIIKRTKIGGKLMVKTIKNIKNHNVILKKIKSLMNIIMDGQQKNIKFL